VSQNRAALQSGAENESFALVFDLGFGQRIEIGDDLGAERCDAIFQRRLQNQGKEAAEHVTVELVEDRPGRGQVLGGAEGLLHRNVVERTLCRLKDFAPSQLDAVNGALVYYVTTPSTKSTAAGGSCGFPPEGVKFRLIETSVRLF
jgi:hypothetical protein